VTEGGLEAFRAEIRRNMEREAGQALRSRAKEAVMDALYEANNIELPAALVESEQDRLLEQAKNNLRQYGISEDRLKDLDREGFADQARKRVTLQLVVRELIAANDFKAESGEVRTLIEQSAAGYEHPEEVVNWYFADKSRLAEVESLVLEDKLVDWILEQAQVTEKPYTFDALMNKGQTE